MNQIAQVAKTRVGKVLITLWALILIILIGTPILSLIADRNELLGNIIFSILTGGILLNISIVLAYIVKNGSLQLSKITWVCLSITVVGIVLTNVSEHQPTSYRDAEIVYAYCMLTLSFPGGFLAPIFLSGIGYLWNFENAGVYVSIFVSWLAFFLLGYFQWFKLFPWIIGKYHTGGTRR